MRDINYIRKLAKKQDIQNQFIASKELGGIKFFINELDFSQLQYLFISYLYFYYNLYQDIYSNQVSKKVLDSEIYEDAYYYYKMNKKDKVKKPESKQQVLSGTFGQDNKIIFTK